MLLLALLTYLPPLYNIQVLLDVLDKIFLFQDLD